MGSGMPHTHALVRRWFFSDTSPETVPTVPFPIFFSESSSSHFWISQYVSAFIYYDYFCAISGWRPISPEGRTQNWPPQTEHCALLHLPQALPACHHGIEPPVLYL